MCLISHWRGYVFVHVPKTGGGSVFHALIGSIPKSDRRLAYAAGHHATALDLRSMLGRDKWKAFFKFGFVRNPYERAISIWSYITQAKPNSNEPKFLEFIQNIQQSSHF